jgi:hypothetical protein
MMTYLTMTRKTDLRIQLDDNIKAAELAQQERRQMIDDLNHQIQSLATYHETPPPISTAPMEPVLKAKVEELCAREIIPLLSQVQHVFGGALEQQHRIAMDTMQRKLKPIVDSTSRLIEFAEQLQSS